MLVEVLCCTGQTLLVECALDGHAVVGRAISVHANAVCKCDVGTPSLALRKVFEVLQRLQVDVVQVDRLRVLRTHPVNKSKNK